MATLGSSFGLALGLVMVVALLQLTTAQTAVHRVGDDFGWRIPEDPQYYANWANGKRFVVGDQLEFNFNTRQNVIQVSKEPFDACQMNGGEPITEGGAKIRLNNAGAHYFICTIGDHCLNGQKLAITVHQTSEATAPNSAPRKGRGRRAGTRRRRCIRLRFGCF